MGRVSHIIWTNARKSPFLCDVLLISGGKMQNAIFPLQNRKGSKMGIFTLERVDIDSTLFNAKIPILDPFRFCKGETAFWILLPKIN